MKLSIRNTTILMLAICISIITLIASLTDSTKLWYAMTCLGDEAFYIVLTIAIYITLDMDLGASLLATLALSASINILLKYMLSMPRPPQYLWRIKARGPGFPSGHSQLSSSFWSFLTLERRDLWLVPLSVSVISSVALSRIALGVHYLHDVLGGIAIGIVIALAGFYIERVLFRVLGMAIATVILSLVGMYCIASVHAYELYSKLLGIGLALLLYPCVKPYAEALRKVNCVKRLCYTLIAILLVMAIIKIGAMFLPMTLTYFMATAFVIAFPKVIVLIERQLSSDKIP